MTEDKDLTKFFSKQLGEEELTQRQWQIIDAAIKIFSEKGFEGSRTSEIAKEAQVAEGTIFRYYKTKKDLLLGLLFPMIVKFFKPMLMRSVEKISANKEQLPIEEVMTNIYLDRLKLVEKNMPLVKTVLIESAYHPELLKPLQKDIVPQVLNFLDEFMQKNIDNGNLKDIDPRLLSRTFMSLLFGYVILTRQFPETFPVERDEEEIKNIVDILLNGIKNKGGR